MASDWQEGHGVREQKTSYKLTYKTCLALSHKYLREQFKKAAGISKGQIQTMEYEDGQTTKNCMKKSTTMKEIE